MKTAPHTIAGIGELLWDVFPHHQRLGGAPTNFVFHCKQLGAHAIPVSSVGADPLGACALEQLRDMGIPLDYVLENPAFPTGTVQVTLDEQGKPSYHIADEVAWDHLPFTEPLVELAAKLDAVCFGTLSQRSEDSRRTIQAFLGRMPAETVKIFDVNLRQAFYSATIIEESLKLATILKVSDEELPILAGFFGLSGDVLEQLNRLRDRFALNLVAYTRGAAGSLLVSADELNDHPGFEGLAVDSVGAGDSFTASMCIGLLNGWPLEAVNRFANEVATFVCTQKGATPELPEELIRKVRA